MSINQIFLVNFHMEIEVFLASVDEKPILRNLMQLYLYEFSTIDNEDVDNDTGLFSFPYLDRYWIEPERYPFIVRVDGNLAGFALLRKGSCFPNTEDQIETGMIVAEFFVMRKYRRTGVGTKLAIDLFNRFPGRWEVAQVAENHRGQIFWRSVIGEYCQGNYEEIELDDEIWKGPVQVFANKSFFRE